MARCLAWLVLGVCTAGAVAQSQPADNADADADAPLSYEFIRHPPGRFVSLESHRLHVDCRGKGASVVLLEPGLGGSAFEWEPVRDLLPADLVVCTYDRAGYGWSDPAPGERTASQIALEADQWLRRLAIDKPLILVGHSFGGLVMRHLARMRGEQVAGLVLVDASHPDQFDRMQASGARTALPKNGQFVLFSGTLPDNLPASTRRKMLAFARMRKTYHATHRELARFGASARAMQQVPAKLRCAVRVVYRGRDLYEAARGAGLTHTEWSALQQDLANLSDDSRVQVATKSGHHVHVDEPELVADIIRELVASGRETDIVD